MEYFTESCNLSPESIAYTTTKHQTVWKDNITTFRHMLIGYLSIILLAACGSGGGGAPSAVETLDGISGS